MRLHHILAAAACSSALFAQAPANDDCANAQTAYLGPNGYFSNVGATTNAADPAWPCGTGGSDVWFNYTADCTGTIFATTCGGTFDTAMEVFDGSCGSLTSLQCNDDSCGLQSEVSWAATAGTTYVIRVGGFSGAQGAFPLNIRCDQGFDFGILGTAEATAGAGTLSLVGGTFRDGEFLRWNYDDPGGAFTGQFGATILNVGNAGSSINGVTPSIPGFTMLWSGSNPAGGETIFGPLQVGGPDESVQIPNGLFIAGQNVRIQGLVLDATRNLGTLPVVATHNAVEFDFLFVNNNCITQEGFEGITAPGAGVFATGWTDGGGTQQWSSRTGGTPSSGTGPSGAAEGSVYMYTETSGALTTADTFILNSPVYSGASVSNLDFQLSRVGGTIGTLEIRIDDGTGTFPTVIATYTGSAASEWTAESIALPTPVPANLQFQFHYTYGGSFTGDLGIDAICLN